MVPKYRHPFFDGLTNVPDRKKELTKIRTWVTTQAHLPQISDEFIYLFLHSSYYNIDKTKNCIENYFTIRANSPILFTDRNPRLPRMQAVKNLANLIRLPKTTPEGYKVLMYIIRDNDPSKFVFPDAVKGFCMYNDVVISEDGLVDGYVVIFDMKDVCIGHLARVSLPTLKAFMFYIQEAHPARLKAIHILNTASWIHHIMRIVLPLVKSELLGIVKFHKGAQPEGVPRDMLPEEYGGEGGSVQELNAETDRLQEKYADWLVETEEYRADEGRRVKKATWWGLFNGANSAEKLDEKTILKNLQVD